MLCVFCIPDVIAKIDRLNAGDYCKLEIIATAPCHKCADFFGFSNVKLDIHDTYTIVTYDGHSDFTLGELRRLLERSYKPKVERIDVI